MEFSTTDWHRFSRRLHGDYAELSEMTGLRTFVTEFAGHVAAEASRT